MMLLALDTTAAVATAALFRDGALVVEREADAGKKHAETALPLIETLLEENGITIDQIDMFAVDIGPGSFTGVRIGVSLVNALAFASGKRVVPVDSLRTLAISAEETEKPVCALIDARNSNAYAALYQQGKTLIEPCAVEIAPFIATLPSDTIFVGDANVEDKTFPRARFVGLYALSHSETAMQEVEPLYLRPSQAERTKQKSVREG
jgi:tRNA threonylcarbamoyladenosine biosynthesis protein TsaB